MSLPDLATACRKSGLRVLELPGWATRGRPASTGGFAPRGVLCHHTGSTTDSRDYVDWMALTGRSDLPAPLCQLALGHDSTVYVCAGGRANHGGTARATGPMPAGDANSLYVGIEAMNSGSEGWGSTGTDAAGNRLTQAEGYARLCAALCAHYDWPATNVRAHRETSVTGKWDPGLLDMDKHRADVARLIANPTTQEDPFMALTEKQQTQLVADVAETKQAVAKLAEDEQRRNETSRDRDKRIADRIAAKVGKTRDEILAEFSDA